MNRRRAVAAVFAFGALLAATPAAADPAPDSAVPDPGTPVPDSNTDVPPSTTYLHLLNGGHVTTPGGADLTLPPGYYIDDASWGRIDGELHRLQDAETRLTAENGSLRSSLEAGAWTPPWWTIASAVVLGAALGYEVERKLQ